MLDPAHRSRRLGVAAAVFVYDTLMTTGRAFPVQPGIAESWEPEPTKYMFHLREGVTFSNGRAMTAEDVAGSIARVVDPKFGSWWASQMGSVKSVEASMQKRSISSSMSRLRLCLRRSPPV